MYYAELFFMLDIYEFFLLFKQFYFVVGLS